jgi:hypothetical protein
MSITNEEAVDALNGGDEQQQTEAPETVRLAKDMGWKDPADWQGEPPKNGFVSASEYIRRSEKILPIVNARARNAEERAQKLEAKLEQMERDHRDNLRRIERMSTVTLERQREQIEAQYAARIEAAAEVGDKDAVRQARTDEKAALKAIDDRLEPTEDEKKATKAEQQKLPAHVQETINGWMGENAWFKPDSDDEMSIVATRKHLAIQKEKPGLSLAENLAEVSKYIRKRYPEAFSVDDDEEDPAPRRGSRVEGSTRAGAGSGSMWARVPADAKGAATAYLEYFLKPGETMEKNAAQARERWATKYFEGDK